MRALFAAPALAVAACGSDSPTELAPPPVTPTMSATAASYLKAALDWEQQWSYWSPQINWTTMRADVANQTPSAQTPRETYPAIAYSLTNHLAPLGDNHSGFWPPSNAPGLVDAPNSSSRYVVTGQMMTPRIAYLSVPGFTGRNPSGRADSTVAMIRELDASNPCGWILDVRLNLGGYFGAIVSGIHPLVADARFGGIRFNNDEKLDFYIQRNSVGYYDPATNETYAQGGLATTTYQLKRPNSPVAVLHGINTASAGETIVLTFRSGSVPYRTFGADTRGATSSPVGRYLPDSAYLNITAALWYDRSGTMLNGAIRPDQAVAGPNAPTLGTQDAVVTAAMNWLQARPECAASGTSAANAMPPSLNRVPRSVVPPPVPGRTTPPGRPLSPFFAAPPLAMQ